MQAIDWLVIHCSRDPAPSQTDIRELDRRHRRQQMLGVKFHFVIKQCGTLEHGRRLDQPAPHAGKWNSRSLAICLVGGWENGKWTNNFTEAQRATLKCLLEELQGKFPAARVVTHRDLTQDTKCPGATYKELGLEYDPTERGGVPAIPEAGPPAP